MKNDISMENLQDARLLSGYVNTYISDIASNEVVAAGSPDVLESFKNGNVERLGYIGDSLLSTIPNSSIVIMLDRDGKVLYNSKGDNTTSFVTTGYFDQAVKKNSTYVTGLYYSDSLNDNVFSVINPVRDNDSTIGYIVISILPDNLDKILNLLIEQQRINSLRNIFIVDNNGIVISTDNKTNVIKNSDISFVASAQKVRNGSEGIVETSNTYDGQYRIIGYSPLPISGWGALVSTPISVVYSEIFKRMIGIFALLSGLSLLIIPIGFFVSGYLTKPIVELSDNMRMIAAGNYKVRARAERKDEIGDLARTFNLMMDDLERTAELERVVELTKKYRLIFERAADPIFFEGIDGKVLDVNGAACKAYGYTRDELLSMNVADLRIPEERPKLHDTLKKCFEEGCLYETVHMRKDGSTLQVEISSAGASIGNRPVIVGVIRDISERKQIEEALRESEERFRALADNIPNLAWMADPNGWIFWYNKQWYDYTGTTHEEMQGWGWQKVHHPDYVKTVTEEWSARIKEGKPYDNIFPLRGKDGNYRWFLTRVTPIKDEQGNIQRWFGTNTDITERIQAEKSLRQSEERLKRANEELSAIVEVISSATATLDLDKLLNGVLERLNKVMKANASIILLKEDDMIRVSSSVGIEEEAKARFSMPIGKGFAGTIAKTRKSLYIEDAQVDPIVISPIIKKKGIRSMLGVPLLRDSDVIGVLHIDWLEIHPYDAQEEHLLQVIANRCASAILNARLYRETRELQQQSQLYLDIMGHDINNLNQTIMLNLELIKDDENLTRDEKESIEKALTSTKSCSALINNVRKLQRLSEEKLHLEPVDLNELIIECINEAHHPEGKQVTINYTPKAGMIVMGVHLLKEVFCNIINNSIKYSGPEVTVDISAGDTLVQGKKYYSIAISDNGMGISDEVKPKLFGRFQRGTTKAHGKGLGLYIVKSLLEKFNGSVKVEDRVPGDYTKGAKFTVLLPAKED
jgi:PAS domain S-box-containing protein